MMRAGSLLACLATLSVACAGVLGIRQGRTSRPFEHRAHVTKGVSCMQCHSGIAGAGDDDPLHLPAPSACVRCHDKPHDSRDCRGCHGEAASRQGAAMARKHLRFEHRTHLKATRGDCVRCHVQVAESSPDALRPTMATCFGCHEHENQWKTRDCAGCHVDLEDERVKPATHVVHDGDWIREHGLRTAAARDLCATCHSEGFCATCHGATVPALPWKLALGDPRAPSLHRAGFRSRHADEARADPGVCSTCHSESSCIDCHSRLAVGGVPNARNPHPAGWLAPSRGGGEHGIQARIDPASCESCHGGSGEQLCVGCHRVGGPGGNPHGPNFSSTKDKLRDLPCRLCHGA